MMLINLAPELPRSLHDHGGHRWTSEEAKIVGRKGGSVTYSRSEPSEATCTKCRQAKGRNEFRTDTRKRNGLQSWCLACTREASEAWYREHPAANAERCRSRSARAKDLVFAKLGGRCVSPTCSTPGGSTDIRCLHIDHVNNDGAMERNRSRATGKRIKRAGIMSLFVRGLADTKGRYQLLCANCKAIKAWEHNKCRRAAESERN